jgi:phospholipase C
MENHRASAVFGNDSAPYENSLRSACGSTSTYEAVGSPSLPNYIGASAGDTFGVTDDAAPSSHALSADNLFRQARAAGIGSRSYEEAMPAPCALASGGRYAVKHNPAAYFVGGDDRDSCQRDDVPFDRFADDLAAGALPGFSFVTPDLCDDTHDCPVATGDAWLARWVAQIVLSPQFAAGTTVVFVVWDEPTPMPLLVVAPSVSPGADAPGPLDHYSLLRTTEELLGLPLLGRAASAPSMRDAFGL